MARLHRPRLPHLSTAQSRGHHRHQWKGARCGACTTIESKTWRQVLTKCLPFCILRPAEPDENLVGLTIQENRLRHQQNCNDADLPDQKHAKGAVQDIG